MEKTREPVSSKIWPDSTCAISVRRKGQILLVAGSLVFSTTQEGSWKTFQKFNPCRKKTKNRKPQEKKQFEVANSKIEAKFVESLKSLKLECLPPIGKIGNYSDFLIRSLIHVTVCKVTNTKCKWKN